MPEARTGARPLLADIAIVAGIEILGALFLRTFILSDSGVVVGLLLLMSAGFVALQLRPAIEERIVAAFARARIAALVLGLVLILGFPFAMQGSGYALHLLILALLYSVLALALNFQLGSANIPNFATGASYGIGAYTSALLAIHFGLSFWATLPIAAAVATFFGFVLGFPSMRTRESYLALVTIAFAFVVHQMLNNLSWTGGPNGLVGIPA
ncbi:MAG TPA: hypothetical protein VK090_03220, partial [Paracoccaceae bacterium]|nr:hypothetical protein [Paracoccaceae bacterium]